MTYDPARGGLDDGMPAAPILNHTIRYVLRKAEPVILMYIPKPTYVTALDLFGKPVGYTSIIQFAAVFTRLQLVESGIGDLVRGGTHEALRWDSAEKADTEGLNAWEGYAGA